MLIYLLVRSFWAVLTWCTWLIHGVVPSDNDVELAKKLKKEYPEASCVALKHTSGYTFEYDKKISRLVASNTEQTELISLKGNTTEVFSWFYDDNSSLEETSFLDKKGKKLYTEKLCGNYEVDDVFYSDARVCAHRLPLTNVGELLSVNMRKLYTDTRYLTRIFFHEEYPVLEREVYFTVPAWADVQFLEVNCKEYTIQKSSTTDKDGITTYRFILKQLPALKREDHSLGVIRTYPHLLVLAKSYTYKNTRTNVVGSVDDLYKWYSQLTSLVKNDATIVKPVAGKLVSGSADELEKVKKIFYWVQDNIRYVAFEDGIAGFKPEDAHKVYQNRYGDCKGMANLTKALLKEAGFDARLCWIGTSHIPYGYETPSLAVNNHMICTIVLGGKRYFLDPTEKFSAFGDYAERIQGKQVLIEDGDKYVLDRIPVFNKDRNLIYRSEEFKLINNQLEGRVQMQIAGESKKEMLYLLDAIRKDKKELAIDYFLSGGDKNITIKNNTLSDLSDREKDMKIDYTIAVENHVNTFDKDVYIDLDLHKEFEKLIFEKDRVSDYDFGKKVNRKHTIKLHLPEGFAIKHLPESLNISNSDFSFKVSYRAEGKTIIYDKELIVAEGIVHKNDFSVWNASVKQLAHTYNDQVILNRSGQ